MLSQVQPCVTETNTNYSPFNLNTKKCSYFYRTQIVLQDVHICILSLTLCKMSNINLQYNSHFFGGGVSKCCPSAVTQCN